MIEELYKICKDNNITITFKANAYSLGLLTIRMETIDGCHFEQTVPINLIKNDVDTNIVKWFIPKMVVELNRSKVSIKAERKEF